MNIFKWLANRAGKVALSTLQMVGLGAVGAAGVVAAGSFLLGDSSSDNTAFSPAAYNPGEVVYVAGANTGSYAGGSYAGGGESQSSVQISTNTFKRLEQQELSRQAAEEMAEYAPDYSAAASAPASGSAYQMGATEGLGTGANAANELALKNDPMAAMQQSMAGVSGMISQVTQQAQAQASQQAAGQEGKAGGAPTLASASKNWGSSGATGGSGGNAFNASFSIQNSGKNAGGKSASASAAEAQAALTSAQAQMQQAMAEGARIRGRSSFGQDAMVSANRDASVQNFRNSKDSKDLEFIRKRSADAAKNRNRSANEGARAFLASTKISGGMMISSENVTTGQGQGSKDFNQDYDSTLRGIKNWGMGKMDEQNRRDKDRHSMQTWFWVAVSVAAAAAIAIPLVKKIPFGIWIALGLAGVATAFCAVGFAKAQAFYKAWGSSGFATTAMILTPVLLAGVWMSFFFSGAAKEIIAKGVKLLGLGAIGAGALGVGYMGGSSGGNAGNDASLEGDSSSK